MPNNPLVPEPAHRDHLADGVIVASLAVAVAVVSSVLAMQLESSLMPELVGSVPGDSRSARDITGAADAAFASCHSEVR